MLQSLLEILNREWWVYDSGSRWSVTYHWFNVFEGVLWCCVGLFVARRFLSNQRSLWEVAYAVGFALFGISDFVEAQRLSSWLIAWKVLNLLGLILLRRYLLKQHYPESRWL